jgi:HEAT repeat protein
LPAKSICIKRIYRVGDNSMVKKVIQKIIAIISPKALDRNNVEGPESRFSTIPNWQLELLSGDIKISDVPDIFSFLLSSNERLKLLAAESLSRFMTNLSSAKLVKVSEAFRGRSSIEWRCDWKNKNPKCLLHPLMSEEEKVTILGLCTFHPNGYFREKAVRALSEMKTGGEIPYLLIRVNDWVMQVRNLSKEQLLAYMMPEHTMSFVKNMPLILRLEDCSRDEHKDIINSVLTVLCSAEGMKSLLRGLESIDSRVRLDCYKVILKAKALDNKTIISYLVKDRNPYNRLFVLRKIEKEIAYEDFMDIEQLLINDKLPQIRVLALEKLNEFQRAGAVDILEKSLFDKSHSVRETARCLLSKYKVYDFAAIYREAIQNSKDITAGIYGLGETGSSGDAKGISGFLNSSETGIVKAAVIALAHLDIQRYKEEIIAKLSDERPGISKAAGRVLYKEIHAGDADSIYKIYSRAVKEHVKVNTAILLCSLSKWDAIRYIIEFCANDNEKISALGQQAVERWKLRYNYSFTAPTEKQVAMILKSLSDFGKGIKDGHRGFIEFSMRDFIK